MRDFQDKVAIVTGAGGGLGRELALACARRGMKLVLADIDAGALELSAKLIRARLPRVELTSLRVDVSSFEEVSGLAQLARASFGAGHLLFNNAGVGVAAPVWQNTVEDWAWVTNVNLYGVAWGIKAFVPMMLEQDEGHVVNIASAAGWFYPAGSGVYNATKAAVVALSETLANDLSPAGAKIGVSVVSPAYFPSELADSSRNRPSALAATVHGEMRRFHEDQVRKALQAGRISAAQIAETTLDAVEQNRFYVFPHDWVPEGIAARSRAAKLGRTAFSPRA